MPERAYTVAEIDALRRAVENKWLFGTYRTGAGVQISRSYFAPEQTKAVEERVRTHMLAGHTADDLYASEEALRGA